MSRHTQLHKLTSTNDHDVSDLTALKLLKINAAGTQVESSDYSDADIDAIVTGSVSGYNDRVVFTPVSNGQTSFIGLLSSVVPIGVFPILEVNGQMQIQGFDYIITGLNLTWLNNDFTLETTDILVLYY